MTTQSPEKTMTLEPDPDAEALLHKMLDDVDTLREILVETIESGEREGRTKESGRTVCGFDDAPREPVSRESDAVDLAPCSGRGPVGIYHSHPTGRQLLAPEHSLPDMANVAFGDVDASVIVGAESSSVVVGAADREAMAEEFRNAVGVDVSSPAEVVEAIEAGRIRRPAGARSDVRAAFDELAYSVETPQPDLAEEIRSTRGAGRVAASTAHAVSGMAPGECARVGACDRSSGGQVVVQSKERGRLRACSTLRRQGRANGRVLVKAIGSVDITDEVIGTTVGMLTSRAIERLFFEG